MQPAHAVNLLTGVACKSGHTELLTLIVRIRTAHADELIPSDSQLLGVGAHILAEESLFKVVMTGRHGSMHGVKTAGTHQFESLVEVQAVLFDVVTQALQVAESGVTLITMIDILLDAQLLQQQHTADTEQNLLLETVFPVTAVKSVGNGLVELGVHFVVGIKEIQFHATHIYTPHISVHLIVVVRHVNHQRITVLVKLTLNGQRTEVLRLVVGNLLAVHRQALGEVTETIEETYGAHVHIGVGCLLDIVTGKHTQTAAVNFQGRVNTVLHAEVSHGRTGAVGLYRYILTEGVVNLVDALHQGLIFQNLLLAVKRQAFQKHHGIVLHIVVNLGIQIAEQVTGLKVPHPPHIVSDFIQALQLSGKARLHGQGLPLRSVCVISFNLHNFAYIIV